LTSVLQKDQSGINFDADFIDENGDPKDLTGATTIDMEFRKPDNLKVVELAITIVDVLLGKVRYTETTTAKTNIIGAWEYRPKANFPSSIVPGRWLQYIVDD